MQRLIIVYNPHSSKHTRIEQEVVAPARELKGFSIGRFEVKKAPLDENAKRLARVLLDGDLVVAAGGDGTGSMALNGIIESGKDVVLAVLGYGNFNDFSRTLGYKKLEEIVADYKSSQASGNKVKNVSYRDARHAKPSPSHIQELYPLEALVDGEHYRYSACYFTVGMFAESTEIFDKEKMRKTLKSGKKSLAFSILQLAKWYFRNRHREFLPRLMMVDEKKIKENGTAELSGAEELEYTKLNTKKQISDLIFVNGKTVAKVMRGGEWWKNKRDFWFASGRLTSFPRLIAFMVKSIFHRMPGKVSFSDVTAKFDGKQEIEIQGEGEYRKVTASTLTVRKSDKAVRVMKK